MIYKLRGTAHVDAIHWNEDADPLQVIDWVRIYHHEHAGNYVDLSEDEYEDLYIEMHYSDGSSGGRHYQDEDIVFFYDGFNLRSLSAYLFNILYEPIGFSDPL